MVDRRFGFKLLSVTLLGCALFGCNTLGRGGAPSDAAGSYDGASPEQGYNYPDDYNGMDQDMGAAGSVSSVSTSLIYFKFDSSALSTVSRGVLDRIITSMKSNPSLRLRIDGHTDERGTEDYNLALGYRRADAARQYVLSCDPTLESRIDIMSYGKTRLAVIGTRPEDAQLNRRDVLTMKMLSSSDDDDYDYGDADAYAGGDQRSNSSYDHDDHGASSY